MTDYMKAIIALLALAVCGSAFAGVGETYGYDWAVSKLKEAGKPLPTFSGSGERDYTMTTRDGERIQIRLPVGLSGQFIQIERPDGSHVSGRIY